MKTINGDGCIPTTGMMSFVDVTDEVWAAMYQAQREMEHV